MSTSNPDEIYMKYWQKVESTFLDGGAGGQDLCGNIKHKIMMDRIKLEQDC